MAKLVPIEVLATLRAEVRRRIHENQVFISPQLSHGEIGEALERTLLFERWPELVPGLNSQQAFYNRYFWLARLAALRRSDAGVQQQLFQLAECPDVEVDWRVLEQLEASANRGEVPCGREE